MNVLAPSYEPFARNLRTVLVYSEWMIERVPADKKLASQLEGWRAMTAYGWNVTALLAPDSKTVVAVGCR